MGMIKEFKEFALKGNFVDMAVGIVIGAAFTKIVTSMVNNIITPVISIFTGGVDFSDQAYPLTEAGEGGEAVVLGWGAFLQATIDFLIVAVVLFMVVKAINTAKKRFEAEKVAKPAAAPAEVQLLTEIRDLLAK